MHLQEFYLKNHKLTCGCSMGVAAGKDEPRTLPTMGATDANVVRIAVGDLSPSFERRQVKSRSLDGRMVHGDAQGSEHGLDGRNALDVHQTAREYR